MNISRYTKLISNGKMANMPKVRISNRASDIYITYNSNLTRLDRIAGDIYQDDTLYWLIMLANPQYYSEFDIPYNSIIRVPMPLNDVMAEFQNKIVKNQVT